MLYEMLAGDPPHTGPTAQAILMRILTEEPRSVTDVRKAVPPNVQAVLVKALEKLPADRFETAEQFAAALENESFTYARRARKETVAEPTAVLRSEAAAGIGRRAVAALAVVAAVAIGLAAWGWLRPDPEPGVPTRAEVTGLDLAVLGGLRLAISPDGRWILAGHAQDGSGPSLYIRAAEDTEWRRLPNTEGATNPTFSPDGQSVAFNVIGTGGVISKVPITGGPALPVAAGNFPHWGLNDTIVYGTEGDLYRVGSAGGDPELLFSSDTLQVVQPHLLPNGRAVVFGTAGAMASRLALFEIEAGEVREILPAGNHPRYVSTGHLIYGHGAGALMGVPFDIETLQTTGSPVTLLPELAVGGGGASQFAVSETDTLIYNAQASETVTGQRTLVEVNLEGVESPLPLNAGSMDSPSYSPDGSRIAYAERQAGELRVYDVATGANPQFASGGYPVWSRNGEYLYFSGPIGGPGVSDGYRRPSDGREEVSQLWSRPGGETVLDVSVGDSIVVVREDSPDRGRNLLLMRQRADSVEFEEFLTAEWNEANGEISPDARWIAYQSDESGEYRVYVHSFPVITGRHSISPGLGTGPVWSPDGRKLYYRSGSRFMAVEVAVEPDFNVLSAPELLFEAPSYTRYQGPGGQRTWDIHPDGSRFVMVKSGDESTAFAEVYLVTNWFEELRQRMGN